MKAFVLIRGGGDLASGAALRLFRSGFKVAIAEIARPLTVRRSVAFSQAVYDGQCAVEEVQAKRVENSEQVLKVLQQGVIPVLVDPDGVSIKFFQPDFVVDGRMLKAVPAAPELPDEPFIIGLGPGFVVGQNCHAVVETMRGPFLGRVYWQGSASEDTGIPETVVSYKTERVLRAPCNGIIHNLVRIGEVVEENQVISQVDEVPIRAGFKGIVRGLIFDGLTVQAGMKVGDVDPRLDPRLTQLVSDKSLAVGGGVLEAILTCLHRADLLRL